MHECKTTQILKDQYLIFERWSLFSEGQMYSEELRSIVKSGVAAAFVGMIYGGLPGARQARERFIQVSQAEIYQNRLDAVVR